mmetsp:Transcript_8685/g.6438  ORF Transcript_8685/g.6438 Transcript_8685/m.6438 type:complete len:103 (+) Transcript_8685:453-761(+)
MVHAFFKDKLGGIFETDTVSKGTSRYIRLFLKEGLSGNKRRKLRIVDRKEKDFDKKPQYLHVALHKNNMDTMQAVHFIGKKLHKTATYFQICGNKDKRGITT